MGGRVRSVVVSGVSGKALSVASVLTVGAWLAGCSSDVSRFDYPAFGLTSNNPQSSKLPTPPQDVPFGQAPAYADGAPPPDYTNGAPIDPKYVYRGPAPAGYRTQTYAAAPYGAPAAPDGFGTVSGQPESYRSGTGRYVTGPRIASAAPQQPYGGQPAPVGGDTSGFDVGVPEADNAPMIRPPVAPQGQAMAPNYPAQVYTGRRPKAGTMVTVLPGETLYQVAKRNGVSVAALMQINHLRSPVVQPGQQLAMPGKGGRSILPPSRPEAANTDGGFDTQMANAAPSGAPRLNGVALTPPPAAPVAPVASAAPINPALIDKSLDNPDGSYTVRAGDSIYSIARKHGVHPEDVAAANGMKDVTKVNFGQTLRMPGSRGGQAQATVAAFNPKPVANTKVAALQQTKPLLAGKAPATAGAPVMNDADQDGLPETGDDPVAATNEAADPAPLPNKTAPALATKKNGPVDPASKKIANADTAPAAEADVPSDGRFRWPVRGRIIGKFGPTGKAGAPNEGIDMAVPQGTEVHAAENGVVAYAGDELKGYGRLVLIRHADNWVTAYAHNDEILVKRGDTIRRGQIIAKSGKTGGVDQPLVHFELRKGSQPVDPMPHMASN